MKILFFSRLFYPHIGGVEKHVFQISKILIKKGHRVTIVCEKHEKNLKTKEKIHGIEIYRIPVGSSEWFKKFRIWWWLWNHKELIRNADIIHCHDVFYWYLPFRFLFARKPVYVTFHGYESYPIAQKSIIMHKLSEILSWGNICVGDFIKKWYGTKPDYVTYGAVDTQKIKNQPFGFAQGEKSKIKNKNSAVFIGRLDEQTGILQYLEAVKLIRKKIPDFEFIVIGDGKYRKEVEKYAKVLGFIKNPEKYFSKYHFAFVSRYLSILEAMVAQRLVFALFDNPVKEDYLKMSPFTEYMITGEFFNEISKQVLFYLKNKEEEKKLLQIAFDWVKNQSWDNVVSIYVSLWARNNEI